MSDATNQYHEDIHMKTRDDFSDPVLRDVIKELQGRKGEIRAMLQLETPKGVFARFAPEPDFLKAQSTEEAIRRRAIQIDYVAKHSGISRFAPQ
jgi:hypothetical protein